jgi:hypothetical protein
VILGDRPVGYWPLATGTTVVDRIGTATAVYTGSPAAATLPNGDPAVAFTTSGQYATVPDADAFSVPTTGQLTLELWIRPDVYDFPDAETSTDGPLVYPLYKGNRTGPGGNIEYAVRMYSRSSTRPNRMSAYLFAPDGGLGAGSYAEDPIILSGWVHLVAVFDGVNKGPDGWSPGTRTASSGTPTPGATPTTSSRSTATPRSTWAAGLGIRPSRAAWARSRSTTAR